MCEVEVDPDTGQVFITKTVHVNDVGCVISPEGVAGQQIGGGYWGVGESVMEESVYDPQSGLKLNDSLLGYDLMLMNDIPSMDCAAVETHQGAGAYGLTGCGENIGAMGYTITHQAVFNAIGKWVGTCPTTPWTVLKAMGKV